MSRSVDTKERQTNGQHFSFIYFMLILVISTKYYDLSILTVRSFQNYLFPKFFRDCTYNKAREFC